MGKSRKILSIMTPRYTNVNKTLNWQRFAATNVLCPSSRNLALVERNIVLNAPLILNHILGLLLTIALA